MTRQLAVKDISAKTAEDNSSAMKVVNDISAMTAVDASSAMTALDDISR